MKILTAHDNFPVLEMLQLMLDLPRRAKIKV